MSEDKKQNKTMEAISKQVKTIADNVPDEDDWSRVVIAYEALWTLESCDT